MAHDSSKHSAETPAPAKKRVEWIDIAKGIGIVFMIVGHTFLNESFSRKLVFSFHMPLFFILAGYTFRVKPTRDVITSSAKRLLVPYVICYWASQFIDIVHNSSFTLDTIYRSLGGFVFASGTEVYQLGFPPAGVVWFLVALFCARVTMNVVMGWFEKRNLPIWVQCLFWIAFAAAGVLIGEVANIRLPLSYDVAMVACLFMYVGYLAKAYDLSRIMRKWWTFPLALALWILCIQFSYLELAARRYDIAAFSIVGACAGSYMVYQIAYLIEQRVEFLKKPLIWLGVNSMMLLCIHYFDWRIVPWQALPILEGVPAPYFVSGCLRTLLDVGFALIVKKV